MFRQPRQPGGSTGADGRGRWAETEVALFLPALHTLHLGRVLTQSDKPWHT